MASNLEALPSLQDEADPLTHIKFLARGSLYVQPGRYKDQDPELPVDLTGVGEVLTAATPWVYLSMEALAEDEYGNKAAGGLGALAEDIRGQAEKNGTPLILITPKYTKESHQNFDAEGGFELRDTPSPEELGFRRLGGTAIRSLVEGNIKEASLDIHDKDFGSTKVLTVTAPEFGELYPGGNSDGHRLYQEVALGFGAFRALKEKEAELGMKIEPSFVQLNEAPTVFAAVAQLDDLCSGGMEFGAALANVKRRTIYTNHTLVQAVEGVFHRDQFEGQVMPNIHNESVQNWIRGQFSEEKTLRLSSLAVELADTKTGVSILHTEVADFKDRYGNQVEFIPVTNGIGDRWILEQTRAMYRETGIIDEFGLPGDNYQDKIDALDINEIRGLKAIGRQRLDEVLARSKDHNGDAVHIPADAKIIDFKRRFVSYKRPLMMFNDPARFARILEDGNAHFVLTGKPHPSDGPMNAELVNIQARIAECDDETQAILNERFHYVQNYRQELGAALAMGADAAVNIPEVGKEACGTSWMKDIANFKVLISTPDGGVADKLPIACLEVSGDEQESLYHQMGRALEIVSDDDALHAETTRELKEYLPVISGARMNLDYMKLIRKILVAEQAAELEFAA